MNFENDLLEVIKDFDEFGFNSYTKTIRTVLRGNKGPRSSVFSNKEYYGKYQNIRHDDIEKMILVLMNKALIGKSYHQERPYYRILNEYVDERLHFNKIFNKDVVKKKQSYFENINFHYNDDDFISSSKYIQDPILFKFHHGNRIFKLDSKLELDFIKELYRIDFINDAISQPLTIKYGKNYNRLYTPDFLLKTYDNKTIMIEVKPFKNFSLFNNITKFKSLKQFSLEREYSYEMIGKFDNEWITFTELIDREYNSVFENEIIKIIENKGEIKDFEVKELIKVNNYDERDLVPIIYLNKLDSKTPFFYNIKK